MGDQSNADTTTRAGYVSGLRILILIQLVVTVFVAAVAGTAPTLVIVALLCVPLIYLIALVVRVQAALDAPGPLAPPDARLASRSGRLGPGMVVVFVAVILCIHGVRAVADAPAAVRVLIGIAIGCAELGALFALVYIGTPKGFGNDGAQGAWKVACYPVPLVLGFLAVLMAGSPLLRPSPQATRLLGGPGGSPSTRPAASSAAVGLAIPAPPRRSSTAEPAIALGALPSERRTPI